MRKKEKGFLPQDYVGLAVIAGTAIFGVYQLGKLGIDWTVEGVRAYKNNKELWNMK